MHWLSLFALLFAPSVFASSWNSSKVSCDSTLRCFLLHSKPVPIKKTLETDAMREINTWYPVPKWKVFLDANKNRNAYSSPYFNKHDSNRTDGNFFNDFFERQQRQRRLEVFERLNIQFLQLKDGNITVKTFGGKINESDEECVALFVVYVHRSKEIQRTPNNSGDAVVLDVEAETVNGIDNISTSCDGAGGCNENKTELVTEPLFNAISANGTSTEFEIIRIPVSKNMTIEMNISEFDINNYTVMIIPVHNNSSMKNEDETKSTDEVIRIPLTRNMSIIVKSDEHLYYNESYVTESITESELVEDTEQVGEIQDKTTESNGNLYSTYISNRRGKILSTSTDPVIIFKNETEYQNDTVTTENTYKVEETPNTEEHLVSDLYSTTIQKLIELNNIEILNHTKNNTTQYSGNVVNGDIEYATATTTTNNEQKSNENLYKVEYSKTFGPYEVKQINSSLLPFIATIHITINNKDGRNGSDYEKYILSHKTSPLEVSQSNFNRNSEDITNKNQSVLERSKRFVIKKANLNELRKSHNEYDLMRQGIIDNENISLANEIGNKYLRRETRMILNKTKGTSPAKRFMNYNPLILPSENTKGQNNSSKLFLFLERHDSYSSTTISKNNEEFNQKQTGKLRNKDLIANEISDNTLGTDGEKGHQTVSGDRNKREVVLLTLIPNKESRENHSKKSELQIVEGSSLDKFSDGWRMKISPGGQRLGENGIKTEKMCDSKDGCSGINDVFNTMKDSESKFHEDNDVEKERFNSNESLGGHDSVNIYNRSLKQGNLDETFIQTAIKRIENNLDVIADEISETPTGLNFKNKNRQNLDDNSEPKEVSSDVDISIKDSIFKIISNNFAPNKKEIPGINRMHVLQNGANSETDSNAFMNRFLRKRSFREASVRRRSRRELRDFTKFNLEALPNNRFTNRNFPGRSDLDMPFILNQADGIYVMNLKESPRRVIPQISLTNYSFIIQNGSSIEEKELQTILLKMIQMNSMNARADPRIMDSVPPRPQNRIKEWLRRGSKWPPNNRPPTEINDHRVLVNRMTPEYDWIIVIPQVVQPRTDRPVTLKPTRPQVVRQFEPNNMSTASEREREDFGQIPDWELVKSVIEQTTNKNNATTSTLLPRENEPRTDVTTQKREPNPDVEMNSMLPPREIPRKIINGPKRKFNFQNPWSPDQHWEFNQWTASYNPWKTAVTTPMRMLMMGGMAGGD